MVVAELIGCGPVIGVSNQTFHEKSCLLRYTLAPVQCS